MVAKRFFYACAGILCLALAYHFGAQSAKAQGGVIDVGNIEYSPGDYRIRFAVGRTIYDEEGNPIPLPVPGSARIVAVGLHFVGTAALLDNGDFYAWDAGANVWRHGNVFGPTPATQPTWGQLKSRYRPGASTAPQDK